MFQVYSRVIQFHTHTYTHIHESESCSVVFRSLQPHGQYSPWDSPARILEWVFPPQDIFTTQGSNPGLPYCKQILYQLSHKGSHIYIDMYILFQILLPYGLLHDIEYSSSCHAEGPCCLSIIYIYNIC